MTMTTEAEQQRRKKLARVADNLRIREVNDYYDRIGIRYGMTRGKVVEICKKHGLTIPYLSALCNLKGPHVMYHYLDKGRVPGHIALLIYNIDKNFSEKADSAELP